ncbi:MAG: dTDP-4-dehydrorhamnose reductase [Lachnospiraceae bacterium]|nr:dTDP-4-dehydrorhamnose reductase [Lachnospiraceae bacterium]
MKVLVTGYNGQLGYDVVKELTKRGIESKGVDIDDFDITDEKAVSDYIRDYNPDVVVHCSAYTAVDKAEDNIQVCRAVNVDGPRNIAKICKELDCKLVYFSTDYVFPGTGDEFYEVDSPTGPLGQYGITKLDGELAVTEQLEKYFIIRISWVFGINGNNFIKTMLRVGKEHDTVRVVDDQIGSPTYTADLSKLVCDMLVTEKYGIYHATNEGVCSWADFTEEIFRLAGYDTKITRVTTEEYGARAPRPKNSRMSKKSLDDAGFSRLPDWKDALRRYLEELHN